MIPAIDFDAAGGVDLDRLQRSLALDGERVGAGQYRVSGGEHEHWVDLYTTGHPRCDCGDHLWRERICKHILAALLREGNERVVRALAPLFSRQTAARGLTGTGTPQSPTSFTHSQPPSICGAVENGLRNRSSTFSEVATLQAVARSPLI